MYRLMAADLRAATIQMHRRMDELMLTNPAPTPRPLPMKWSFGSCKGSAVAILGNGPTLVNQPERQAFFLPGNWFSIGTNRSWMVWPSLLHVAVEKVQAAGDAWTVYQSLARGGRLFVAGEGWPMGNVMPILEPSRKGVPKFSRDIDQGVVVSIDGVGSVVYVAIQLAAYLGFSPIYLLGVDLYGEHFHGLWKTAKDIERQNELFRHVPSDVEVYVVGSPKSKAVFPKKEWSDVL